MSDVDYVTMSDRALKRRILSHRDDQEAFYTYLDLRHSHSDKSAIELDDPAWEEKVISAIQAQLNSRSA